MRRLISITALALFLAVPLCAQRGGHMGGARGGFGAGRGGFGGARGLSGSRIGGGHFSGGMRGGFSRNFHSPVAARGFHSRGFSRGPYLHNRFHRGFRTHGFRNNCFGWGCRGSYGYLGWGYYDPWLWDWWNDDYAYDDDYNRNLAMANQIDRKSLTEQRLLRQEEAEGDQDSYAPRSYTRPNSGAKVEQQQSNAVVSPTVLIFRDQHQKEIRNYAIVGDTLWNFAPERREKIPLANLDLAATVKANDDRGVTFRVPGGNEAE